MHGKPFYKVDVDGEVDREVPIDAYSGEVLVINEDDHHYVYEIEIRMSKNREADIEILASDGKVLEIDKEREND